VLKLLKKIQGDVKYLTKLEPGTPWSETDKLAAQSFQNRIKQVENYVLYGITPAAQQRCIQDHDDHDCIYDVTNCVMHSHTKISPHDDFKKLNFSELEVKQVLHEMINESKIMPDQISYHSSADQPEETFTKFTLFGLRSGGCLKIKVTGDVFMLEKLSRLINRKG